MAIRTETDREWLSKRKEIKEIIIPKEQPHVFLYVVRTWLESSYIQPVPRDLPFLAIADCQDSLSDKPRYEGQSIIDSQPHPVKS
ncbi:hypothetical protein PoB_006140200 [Plakobranchus ocellatus]|uniref:Uncharacterized protein n=1 Tax=Plakobranchus ocellatus TaxID=259542 RepID=A0AAV4CSM8_9GAST|nr:hypothetical protein PoB_006140200 [Plakobranchus ocellatus]